MYTLTYINIPNQAIRVAKLCFTGVFSLKILHDAEFKRTDFDLEL